MSKISLDVVKVLLTTEEMKKVTGGSGGNEMCFQQCMYYDNTPMSIIIYGTCYDAYHMCNQMGGTANCACNGFK